MLDINFADGRNNAIELMILTSSEKTDKIIEIFRKRYRSDLHPMRLLQQIYDELNINENDFTQSDVNRLNHELNRVVRCSF